MSDIILNGVAQLEAEIELKRVIAEYNNPELTAEGKREALQMSLFSMFCKGVKFCKEAHGIKDPVNEYDPHPPSMKMGAVLTSPYNLLETQEYLWNQVKEQPGTTEKVRVLSSNVFPSDFVAVFSFGEHADLFLRAYKDCGFHRKSHSERVRTSLCAVQNRFIAFDAQKHYYCMKIQEGLNTYANILEDKVLKGIEDINKDSESEFLKVWTNKS